MADPIFNSIIPNPFGLSNVGKHASPTFVDIDGDNDLDAFIGEAYGNIEFFSNTGTASNPIFVATAINPFNLINVDGSASPSFVDIDSDGDLDAFIGASDGDLLFFENIGERNNVTLASASINPYGFSNVGTHADPTFVDIDGDGDMDAFVGNYDGDILFFENTGTASSPSFIASETNPFGLSSVGRYMASPTFVDIDGDGDMDAFVSTGGNYNNPDSTWFFRNVGTLSDPLFYRDSQNPFGLSSVGGYTDPTFVDIDADNDLDTFIGNSAGDICFFQNIGIGDLAYFSSSSFGVGDVGLDPETAFGDIDGDGDLDAFVGRSFSYYDDEGGNILFFENTGTSDAPVFAASASNPFGLSNVGNFASPTLVDIDNDNDLDIFVGNDAGEVLFLLNTGTANNPAFAAPETNLLSLGSVGKYAIPTFVDIDKDNDLDAFVSDNADNTFFFENIGTSTNPAFGTPEKDPFGLKGNPDFIDVDSDSDLDVFVEETFFINTGTASSPIFIEASGLLGLPENFSRFIVNDRTFADIDGDGDLDAYVTGSYEYAGSYPLENFYINNSAPNVANLTATETYTENEKLNLKDIIINDPDSANATVTLTLSDKAAGSLSTATSGTINSTYDSATGTWTASGPLADVNTLLSDLSFVPSAGFNDSFTINTSISDGVAASLIGSKDINALLLSTSENDILTGTSSHNDTVSYEFTTAPVVASLNINTPQDTGGSKLDTLIDIDHLIGSNFNDTLIGNMSNNTLEGRGGNDDIKGWSGADTIAGGDGTNILTGGVGNDIFRFTSRESLNTITDFSVADDTIQLEDMVFTALMETGGLAASRFRIGTEALDADDFILYSSETGELLYDEDGNGTVAAVQLAMIGVSMDMNHADIIVI